MLTLCTRFMFIAELMFILVLCTFYSEANARAYNTKEKDTNNKITDKWKSFSSKKPRSVQFGVLPRYQSVYSRQNLPVRPASVPAAPYRLPGVRRLNNIARLSTLPGLQKTYIPVVTSLPGIRYPAVLQQTAAAPARYVIPYGVNMPAQRLAPTASSINDDFGKHYNEKDNTLPSMASPDEDQDGTGLRRKIEDKNMDLSDDFDHFLDNLGKMIIN